MTGTTMVLVKGLHLFITLGHWHELSLGFHICKERTANGNVKHKPYVDTKGSINETLFFSLKTMTIFLACFYILQTLWNDEQDVQFYVGCLWQRSSGIASPSRDSSGRLHWACFSTLPIISAFVTCSFTLLSS